MSIEISFNRLQKSESVVESVNNRIVPVLQKFKISNLNRIKCEVAMLNSRVQAGPAFFKVKLFFKSLNGKELVLVKSDKNFHKALSLITKALPPVLKKNTDKKTTKTINLNRKLKTVENFKTEKNK